MMLLQIINDYKEGRLSTSQLRDALTEEARSNNAFSLSEGQKGLWMLQRIEPDSSAYNVPMCFRTTTRIDLHAFESACRLTAQQHPILSHTFIETERGLRQDQKSEWSPFFLKRDLTKHSEEDILSFLRERSKIPFSLENDSLMRVEIYSADGDASYVLIVIHHIVFDGSSLAAFLTTLFDFYLALLQGETPKIQQQLVRYNDFVKWEKGLLQSHAGQECLDYWKTQLADLPSALEIPSDRPRVEIDAIKGKTYTFRLSKILSRALKEFSLKNKTNNAVVFLAIFKTLLYRYSNQNDIVIGMPTLGRPDECFDRMVGYFINTIAVRSRYIGDQSFIDFMKELRGTVADGLERSQYPFPALVRELNVIRAQNHAPVFQVVFSYQNFMQAGGIDRFIERYRDRINICIVDEIRQEGEYELELEIREETDWFRLNLKYDSNLFDESTIKRVSDSYLRLIEGIIENPNKKPGEYPIINCDEERQIVVDWNNTQNHYPIGLCVHELFERIVAEHPNIQALIEGDRSLSYAELNEKANQIARYLVKRGVKQRSLVAILTPRSIDTIIGLLAILKSGSAYVPIDPQFPQERIDRMMKDCGASFAIVDESVKNVLACDCCEFIDISECWSEISSLDVGNLKTDVNSDDLIYISYTSGTTGTPKGVEIRHKSVHRLVAHRGFVFLNQSNTLLQYAPLSFDASTFEIWGSLCTGARLVVCPNGIFGLEELGELIIKNRVTVLWLTSALFGKMVENRLSSLKGVRYLLAGGDVIHPAHVRRVLDNIDGITLINGYGPTENTTFTTVHSMTASSTVGNSVPIGRPLDNTQVFVLNSNMAPVPVGVVGELYTGGDGLARGYWKQPELTKEKFIDDLFSDVPGSKLYKTGDLVYYRPDGTLMFVGRVDNQVKIRGFRIEPGEIENRLSSHPMIEDCAIVVKKIDSNKHLVAYYATKVGGNGVRESIERSDLKDWLRSHLPEHMIPSFFIHIEQMPVTMNGKTDRSVLQENDVLLEKQTKEECIPNSEIETNILDIWKDVLGHCNIGLTDGFFDVGGDSLLAVVTADRIKSKIEPQFGVTDLFKYSNVREIGAYIRRLKKASSCERLEKNIIYKKESFAPTNGKGKNSIDGPQSIHVSSQNYQEGYVYPEYYETSLSIVGISCQFPGASDRNEFWNNIREGKESIRFYSDEELIRSGLSDGLIRNPHFIPLNSTIDGKERFDADFFNISPRDAELMDPQLRLLMMHSWAALEDAGHTPESIPNTAVFVSASGYSQAGSISNTSERTNVIGGADDYVALILAQSGTIPTMISHKLGLKGPSFSIHSNCSSSLSGLYTAAQCLLAGECDHAIVGAANIFPPQNRGYFHQPGLNFSSDGHCRAFDSSADGMIGGEGVAVIVLKRTFEAIEAGDRIYALLRGIRVNNDGDEKVGFYAPSVKGQADVIQKVLNATNVNPETISFVEAHGTGTKLGDPIEFNALTDIYRKYTTKKQFCGIGSVKTNIGHLDTAAGLAGCIKTVLSLYYGEIPPTINYKTPNPNICLEDSPFYVVNRLKKWKGDGVPQRAALSSFGLGGTNAHAILEAYKNNKTESDTRSSKTTNASLYAVPLSAKDNVSLKEYVKKYIHFFNNSNRNLIDLDDVSYTLQMGRTAFAHRVLFLVKDISDLVMKLDMFLEGQASCDGLYRGKADDTVRMFESDEDFQTVIDKWIANRNIVKLGELWVKGLNFDWRRLYTVEKPRRISLPTYPFTKYIYHFPGSKVKDTNDNLSNEEKDNYESDLNDLIYVPVWEPQTGTSFIKKNNYKTVLIVSIGESKKIVEGIQSYIYKKHEKTCIIRIFCDDGPVEEEKDSWFIDRGDQNAFERCLKQYENIDSLFFVCGTDRNIEDDDYSQATGVRAPEIQLLRLTKYLKIHNPSNHKMDCTIITIDTVQLGDDVTNPFGGGVAGIAYAIAQSNYQWDVRNIDISSVECNDLQKRELLIESVLNENASPRGETIKIDNLVRYRQRLNPHNAKSFNKSTPIRNEGVYVILGGSGSVGRIITRYLIQKYDARVVWIGRRAKKDRDIQDAIQSYKNIGVAPEYIQADVTDFSSMKTAAEIISERFGVVNGAIFSGVVVQYDNSIDNTKEEDFRAILEVKTLGGIHFYNAFKDVPLDFMCYFSSAQAFSFTGATNLSAYATGITFSDTYVRRIRKSAKFPIGIINWGFWMAPKEGFPENAVQFSNIGFLRDREGYDCFERFTGLLCSGDFEQALCMRVSPAVEQIMPLNKTKNAVMTNAPIQEQRESKSLETLDVVTVLIECLAKSLKRPVENIEINVAFFDYGVDSIISVGFMNRISERIGIELNSAVIFDYSTIESLANYIEETYGNQLKQSFSNPQRKIPIDDIEQLQNKFFTGDLSVDALLEEIES